MPWFFAWCFSHLQYSSILPRRLKRWLLPTHLVRSVWVIISQTNTQSCRKWWQSWSLWARLLPQTGMLTQLWMKMMKVYCCPWQIKANCFWWFLLLLFRSRGSIIRISDLSPSYYSSKESIPVIAAVVIAVICCCHYSRLICILYGPNRWINIDVKWINSPVAFKSLMVALILAITSGMQY